MHSPSSIYSNMQKFFKTCKKRNNTYCLAQYMFNLSRGTGERYWRKLIFMTLTSCIWISFRQKTHSQWTTVKKKTTYEGIYSDFKINNSRYYSKKLLKCRDGVFCSTRCTYCQRRERAKLDVMTFFCIFIYWVKERCTIMELNAVSVLCWLQPMVSAATYLPD